MRLVEDNTKKRVKEIDPNTGEILKDVIRDEVSMRETLAVRAPYAAITVANSWWKDLSPAACKVAFVLIGQIRGANIVLLTRTELSRMLGMERQRVGRAIKELIQVGFMVDAKPGFVLNELMVYKNPRKKK